MDNARTADEIDVGQRGRVESVVALEPNDPYVPMVAHMGIREGTCLIARGYDDDNDVHLFEDVATDRRFGIPLESCRRIRVVLDHA